MGSNAVTANGVDSDAYRYDKVLIYLAFERSKGDLWRAYPRIKSMTVAAIQMGESADSKLGSGLID